MGSRDGKEKAAAGGRSEVTEDVDQNKHDVINLRYGRLLPKTWYLIERTLQRSLLAKFLQKFMCMIRRRILLLQTLNSCKTRLLSDKPRQRKWSLPPIVPNSIVSNLPSNNISRTTKKAAHANDSRSTIRLPHAPSGTALKSSTKRPELESWAVQRLVLKQKYPKGYHPFRKVSPDAIEGIRILHRQV